MAGSLTTDTLTDSLIEELMSDEEANLACIGIARDFSPMSSQFQDDREVGKLISMRYGTEFAARLSRYVNWQAVGRHYIDALTDETT